MSAPLDAGGSLRESGSGRGTKKPRIRKNSGFAGDAEMSTSRHLNFSIREKTNSWSISELLTSRGTNLQLSSNQESITPHHPENGVDFVIEHSSSQGLRGTGLPTFQNILNEDVQWPRGESGQKIAMLKTKHSERTGQDTRRMVGAMTIKMTITTTMAVVMLDLDVVGTLTALMRRPHQMTATLHRILRICLLGPRVRISSSTMVGKTPISTRNHNRSIARWTT